MSDGHTPSDALHAGVGPGAGHGDPAPPVSVAGSATQAPQAAPERHLSSAAATPAPAAIATANAAAAGSPQASPPLVLVHGLFDTPRLFHGLRARLAPRRSAVLAPHLPHALGSVPLESLAADL
ncbi:MAG: hypothetical protein ACKOZT_09140, partial [Cyanobium sp.]